MPTMRPWSMTTSDPRLSFAMVDTASAARPEGSMLTRRLPFTRRISLTCIARSSYPTPIESELRKALSMPREYPQKAALVTGGAQGIGSDIARLLSQRGYRVAIADVKPAREGGMLFIRCDISREPAVRSCVRQVLKRFGRLDALVNNAGIASPANGPV